MLEAGITPDVQAINSLINAFSKAGSPDQALKVSSISLLHCATCACRGWCFGSRCCVSLLASTAGFTSFCARLAAVEVERFSSRTDTICVPRSAPTLTSAPRVFSTPRCGFPLPPRARRFVARTHTRARAQAFDEMSRYGVTPSVITFNSLIDACGRAGDVDRARQVFSRLAQAGLRANDRTFSALIHSHAVQGQVRCASFQARQGRLAATGLAVTGRQPGERRPAGTRGGACLACCCS